MKCPYCSHQDDKVLDTRVQREGNFIRRRRECLNCHGRFSTQETVMEVFPLVIKKDGRREPFNKDKILNGIKTACQKRPVSLQQMQEVVERVAKWVVDHYDHEVLSKSIGEKLMKEMFKLDDVAYVRFASVYRQFKDIHEFMNELEVAKQKDDTPPFELTPPPQ
ncbi:MAG: transcriptional regulator NrdR [Oligoflexia bacterium]|nr:transcriptional regulator NrdR [Oligoflexia bacterium]